MPGTGPVFLPA